MTRRTGKGAGLMRGAVQLVGGGLLLVLAGCDYWPPALQTEIEQLKADLQTISAERARLEQQVVTLTKAREELQTQVDQLTRVNKERASTIMELEHSVRSAREHKSPPSPKVATKSVAKPKPGAKPGAKSAPATVKSSSTKKTTTSPAKKKPAETGTFSRTIR